MQKPNSPPTGAVLSDEALLTENEQVMLYSTFGAVDRLTNLLNGWRMITGFQIFVYLISGLAVPFTQWTRGSFAHSEHLLCDGHFALDGDKYTRSPYKIIPKGQGQIKSAWEINPRLTGLST